MSFPTSIHTGIGIFIYIYTLGSFFLDVEAEYRISVMKKLTKENLPVKKTHYQSLETLAPSNSDTLEFKL